MILATPVSDENNEVEDANSIGEEIQENEADVNMDVVLATS